MKFLISSSVLSSRLQTLSKVINNKNSLPILGNFLFEVENGVLTLTASDSDNMMLTSVNVEECDGDGNFTIPAKTILDATRELPEQPLRFEISLESMEVTINYQNGVYNLTAQNADEYPRHQLVSDDAFRIDITSKQLAENLGRTLFATAQEELRPVMNGVFFDLTKGNLAIVASDGHKLVRNSLTNIASVTPCSFILPKKPATLLKNVLAKNDSVVVIKFNQSTAEIHFADGMLVCRLIEGRYPNYESVIPQENPYHVTIDRMAFVSALKRVLPFASESSQLVRLHLTVGNLELFSEDLDFATNAKESIICDYSGSPMDIGFKGGPLTEVLSNLDSEEVVLQLADPSRAGVIEPVQQPEDENVLMLIMPMLLND